MKIGRLLWRIGDYLRYRSMSVNEHGVHSPFVFKLLTEVIRNEKNTSELIPFLALRKELLSDKSLIPTEDHGAGSTIKAGKKAKSVAEICRQSAITPTKGALLFRLARHFSPEYAIELGTNLGLGTTCLAAGCPNAHIYTIEGNTSLSKRASAHFSDTKQENVQCLRGLFLDVLPDLLNQIPKLDLAFIDGDHTYHGTIRYFELLRKKSHPGTVFIFDDIHWSAEMKRAWDEITGLPESIITIDFYDFGFVFFRTGVPKQHFILR